MLAIAARIFLINRNLSERVNNMVGFLASAARYAVELLLVEDFVCHYVCHFNQSPLCLVRFCFLFLIRWLENFVTRLEKIFRRMPLASAG